MDFPWRNATLKDLPNLRALGSSRVNEAPGTIANSQVGGEDEAQEGQGTSSDRKLEELEQLREEQSRGLTCGPKHKHD